MLPRVLEPEVMDTAEEARDYDAMDHAEVNRRFVDDLLALAGSLGETRVRVLDVGTGTALIPLELCARAAAVRVTAIDLAAEMLQLGQRHVVRAGLADRIKLDQVDAKALPEPDGTYDWVVSNSIVHHIPEPLAVLREMRRVLRPGGLLFVRDLMRLESAARIEQVVAKYAAGANARQQQLFRASLHAALTLDEVQQLLIEIGLPPGWATATSDRHWTIAGRLA